MKTLATITLNVPQCSQGLHLRWYANGWHYLTLQVGDESYLTAGLFSNTEANAKQRIAVEDVPAANLDALIALARVGSFDVLTPKGWRNGTFDGGDITTFETDANYYRAEFMLNVYGKTYPYSPVTIAPPEPVLNDLDILRQIRNANPTSQLPTLWSEDKDPYTQWNGVTWTYESRRVVLLDCSYNQLTTLNVTGLTALQGLQCSSSQLTTLNVTGLTALQELVCDDNKLITLNVTGLTALQGVQCNYNQLITLNVAGLTALQRLVCDYNKLLSLATLTSIGLITQANFTHNLMPPTETDRLIALGFTSVQVLPQDI